MWIHGLRSGGPASSRSTRWRPFAVSRLASTEPALPAPTTMKSNVSVEDTLRDTLFRGLRADLLDRLRQRFGLLRAGDGVFAVQDEAGDALDARFLGRVHLLLDLGNVFVA